MKVASARCLHLDASWPLVHANDWPIWMNTTLTSPEETKIARGRQERGSNYLYLASVLFPPEQTSKRPLNHSANNYTPAMTGVACFRPIGCVAPPFKRQDGQPS